MRFTEFLSAQGFSWHKPGTNKYRFIVYYGHELAHVWFKENKHILLWCRPGLLSTALLSWLRQAFPLVEEHELTQWMEDPYRFLLPPAEAAPTSLPSDGFLLDPSENQLAEVARLLGYAIYQRASSPRYLVISQEQRVVAKGDVLTATIVDLVRFLQHGW